MHHCPHRLRLSSLRVVRVQITKLESVATALLVTDIMVYRAAAGCDAFTIVPGMVVVLS